MSATRGYRLYRWVRARLMVRLERRAVARNLRVGDDAAIDCQIGGCRWGTPLRGACECK